MHAFQCDINGNIGRLEIDLQEPTTAKSPHHLGPKSSAAEFLDNAFIDFVLYV